MNKTQTPDLQQLLQPATDRRARSVVTINGKTCSTGELYQDAL